MIENIYNEDINSYDQVRIRNQEREKIIISLKELQMKMWHNRC